jgi:1-acyl-sn-glycerol-3-phosphate acyltransferase
MFVVMVVINIIFLFHDKNEPLTGIKYWIVRAVTFWSSCCVLHAGSGAVWMSVTRPKICYKHLLGPDWKADYDVNTCATIINNHSSFLDAVVNTMLQLPSHIAKKETKKIPFMGSIAQACGCMFLDRDSKESKGTISE